MTPTLDISTDFATVTDGLASATVDGTAVTAVLRRAVSTNEAAKSNGKYLSSDTVFHVDVAEKASRPAVGGLIVDADGNWTILEVAKQSLSNRWRCVCRQLYLDPSFTVTIQKATYAKGASGALEPTWSDEATGVAAKIVIDSEERDLHQENWRTLRNAIVYFAASYPLTPQHRIIGPNDETLRVLSWEGFDEIKQLFAAKCELYPSTLPTPPAGEAMVVDDLGNYVVDDLGNYVTALTT